MTAPGSRLRAMCARFCSQTTLEQLIDPVLSDLQTEYLDACSRGEVWRSRWVRAAGYIGFFKAVAMYSCERAARTLTDWSADDRQSMVRTIGFSSLGIAVVTVLLVLPPLQRLPAHLAVYVIPQALPLAIPLGVTFGILAGFGGGVVSARQRGAALAIALACSVAAFATMAWMIPATGQAFRIAVAQRVHPPRAADVHLAKGAGEMTFSELRQKADSLTRAGLTRSALNLTLTYHTRLALSCATLALALFAVAVTSREPVRRWILAVAACGAFLAYYFLLTAATMLGRESVLPVIVAAWLPNAVFATASAAWPIAARTRNMRARLAP
jgi:hypothetical protein